MSNSKYASPTRDMSKKSSIYEFKALTLDQWCAKYLKGLERATVSVKSNGGKLEWRYRGREPKTSLTEALGQKLSPLEEKQYLLLQVEGCGCDLYGVVAAQLSHHGYPYVVLEMTQAASSADLAGVSPFSSYERAFFSQGLCKHPAYYDLSGPARKISEGSIQYGCYVSSSARSIEYDLTFLGERRDLHMDMLRETGERSDAHVLRYHFAAKRILSELGSGATIIDCCSGMGYGTRVLQELCNPSHVTGVDIDARATEYASAIFSDNDQISFKELDILSELKQQDTDSIDAIVMFEGLEHVDDVEAILAQVNRVLKPTGVMISSIPNAWVNEQGDDDNPWHLSVFDWDSYRATLSRHLSIDSTFSQIGNRYNENGKWYPAPPSFEVVDVTDPNARTAEWFLAVCRPRSSHLNATIDPMDYMTFELKEVFARIQDPSIKVVSFDIFDTLLARPTIAPEDVFYILQQNLVEQYGELFSGFAVLRMLAEKNAREIARQKGLGDITYDEIYECLAPLMGLNETDLLSVKQDELDLERRFLTPRLGVKRIYEYALELGKRIIVISDMYLPSSFLGSVLRDQGYDQVSTLWVSSEHKVQKRTGLLFEKVLDELSGSNIGPEEVLHIGDNKSSDIDAAAQYGMLTFHTPKATERYAGSKAIWPSGPNTADLQKVDLGFRSFVGCQINATFHDPLRLLTRGTVFDQNPYLFGRLRMAPFVYFAMDSFLQHCIRSGIKQVLFATRDGHVVQHVFRRIAQHRGVAIDVQDLAISRGMLDLLQCQGPEQLCRYLGVRIAQGKKASLFDVLSALTGQDMDVLNTGILASIVRRDPKLLTEPMRAECLGSYCGTIEKIWPMISSYILSRSETTMTYLRSRNIDKRTAIWDVGYFHSIAHTLTAQGIDLGLSAHLVETGHHQSRVSRNTSGFDTHSFLGAINNINDQHPFSTKLHALFVELLLSDPSTASRTVFTSRGDPVVQPEIQSIQVQNRSRLDALHRGIYDAVDLFHDAYGTLFSQVNVSPTELLSYAFHNRSLGELLYAGPLMFENNGLNIVSFKDGKFSMTKPTTHSN